MLIKFDIEMPFRWIQLKLMHDKSKTEENFCEMIKFRSHNTKTKRVRLWRMGGFFVAFVSTIIVSASAFLNSSIFDSKILKMFEDERSDSQTFQFIQMETRTIHYHSTNHEYKGLFGMSMASIGIESCMWW